MSDNNLGFGKFVPGFDFLQGLAKQAGAGVSSAVPQMPNLSSWVAPTLSVEEIEKRIEELKAVHFWLDQNSKALGATIQALEVQKMTLATLKGMNFNFADVANAFKLKAGESIGAGLFGGAQKAAEKTADTAKAAVDIASGAAKAVVGASKVAVAKPPARKKASAAASGGVVDPMQWWGALTQQFQGIAASAMKDAARQTAVDTTRNLATGFAKEAIKSATGMAKAATKSVTNNAGRATAKPRKTTKTVARKRS